MIHVKLIGLCIAALLILVMALVQLQKRRQQRAQIKWNEEWDGAEDFDAILGVHKVADGHRTPVIEPELDLFDPMHEELKKQLQQDHFAIHIMAKPGHQFMGYELHQALVSAGLRFGEMDIYHYSEDQEILFSVAQATQPGTFDLDDIGGLVCQGLTLFVEFGQDDHYRLTKLIDTCRDLAQDLDGEVRLNQTRELIPLEFLSEIPNLYQAW